MEKELVEAFAKGYLKQADTLVGTKREEKFDYVASNTKSPLRDYMKLVNVKNQQSRVKMLNKWTKDEKFDPKSVKLGNTSKERKAVIEAIEGKKGKTSAYKKSLRSPLKKADAKYFKVIDVAARRTFFRKRLISGLSL